MKEEEFQKQYSQLLIIINNEYSRIIQIQFAELMSEEIIPQAPKQIKKQNSYTYWVDDKNKSRDLPLEHQPKKLQVPVLTTSNNENGPSAWNTIGTWEEKKISLSELQNQIKQLIKERLESSGNDGYEVGDVKIEGDAYKVYKKNKWNVVYEVKGSIEVKKEDKKGKLKLIELSDMGEREYEVTGSSQIKKLIQKEASELLKLIENALSTA